jgi:fructosamine-3-kinase
MRDATRARIDVALAEVGAGARIERVSAVAGGDINEAYAVVLHNGERVFVKTHASANPLMFPAEARGLAWLEEAAALRVPRVIAVSGGASAEPQFLVLEYIAPGRPRPDFAERLGQGLAALHRSAPPSFGFEQANFIGLLDQTNTPRRTWAEFYREQRLLPQLALAERRGRTTPALRRDLGRVCEHLEVLVGPEEPPARLHGDLWGGNCMVDALGAPVLIDPAVYGGHREMDLAMMRLFGGFGPRVFAAYAEAYPLADGHEERVLLHQLYPLLVHLNLFGGGYLGSVERVLAELVRQI